MLENSNVPYGALYSFQPEYLNHLVHDEVDHESERRDDLPNSGMRFTALKEFLLKYFRDDHK